MYRTFGFQMPIFTHPVPLLEIHKAILTVPRETTGQPASLLDLNCGQGSYEPILRVQKGGRFAHTHDRNRFAPLSEIRTLDIMDTLYILASFSCILRL